MSRVKMPAQKPGQSEQTVCTPPELLAAVKYLLKIPAFNYDLAADPENAVADSYFTEEMNALNWPWAEIEGGGWHWLNHPYGQNRLWVEKCAAEAAAGARIVQLIPASVGAGWWRDFIHQCPFVKVDAFWLSGRCTFVGHETPYPKDLAILLWGGWAERKAFQQYYMWDWQRAISEGAEPY